MDDRQNKIKGWAEPPHSKLCKAAPRSKGLPLNNPAYELNSYASSCLTTWPATSVRRKSRPWKMSANDSGRVIILNHEAEFRGSRLASAWGIYVQDAIDVACSVQYANDFDTVIGSPVENQVFSKAFHPSNPQVNQAGFRGTPTLADARHAGNRLECQGGGIIES